MRAQFQVLAATGGGNGTALSTAKVTGLTEPMDDPDPAQGKETLSQPSHDLPASNKGRQRKKNPKYFDYDTTDGQSDHEQEKAISGDEEKSFKKSPVRRGRPKRTRTLTEDRGLEADRAPQEPEAISEKTPKRRGRPRRSQSKGNPTRKTPAQNVDVSPLSKTTPKKVEASLPPAEGLSDATKQENGTQKPKRKYVKKQVVKDTIPLSPKEIQAEPNDGIQPLGRRQRGAAKAALKYLQALATQELSHQGDEVQANGEVGEAEPHPVTEQKTGRKRKWRKSDSAEDEEFVPDKEDEEEVEQMEDEEAEEEEDLREEIWMTRRTSNINKNHQGRMSSSGLPVSTMSVIWDATNTHKKFREEHLSSWVFPDWIPSTSDWKPVPQSELEKYVPQELQSAGFKVVREGLKQESVPPVRLDRFDALPPHPERWDMFLNAGGPVWAMDWCPTPDGAPASQYLAVACHQGMDDWHFFHKTYTGSGLVQLWDMGKLEYNVRPESKPALAYGLAQERGFIWHLKFCPSGVWELPTCSREAPFLPRLALLAVATSTSVVTIYSLPHPDALNAGHVSDRAGGVSERLPIYTVEEVVTLKLGSLKCPRQEKSGQVLAMDWLPEKPHNIMALGFYDGIVGLWDLTTKSSLLRVRDPHQSLSLLPYKCFLAHDHAVRALSFCPASRHLLVTAGEDRFLKTWDLRRLYEPITVQKRNLVNEIYWPLNSPGLLWAQEVTYATNGSHGIHYFDHHMRSFFAAPRMATLWSISCSDWLNSMVTSDMVGEVILLVLPELSSSPQYIKRASERRFPVYFSSLVPYNEDEEEDKEVKEAEEGGEPSEKKNEENGDDGDRSVRPSLYRTYRDSVRRFYLHHDDMDVRSFAKSEKRPLWKRMKETEGKMKINMDELPLAALHKVRFSPNLSSHTWLASGGQTGLVRLHCLQSLNDSQVQTMVQQSQDQFAALHLKKQEVLTETDPL